MTEPGMHKGDEFAGKVALVTGAARNIGRAIALSLASGGAKVAVNTRSNIEQARGVVDEIKALGTEARLTPPTSRIPPRYRIWSMRC